MSRENRIAFQQFLNSKGASLTVDGAIGPLTTSEFFRLFANRNAAPIRGEDINNIAIALRVSPRQVRAVAAVESNGGGFERSGHPKILWERHWFFRRIGVRMGFSVHPQLGPVADPTPGGYTLDANRDGINDSWQRLKYACGRDPVAAFESCSWGKFQIMGGHWRHLGYRSVFDFAWSMRESELGHYNALMNFIRANNLNGAMARLSTNPMDNREFARRYNGPNFEKNAYHIKLAREMGR
jgi:hypothetical protein